jgi:hypothetical protein
VRYRDNGGVIGPYVVASQNAASGVWSIVEEEIDVAAGAWPSQNPPFVEYMALNATAGSYTSGIQGIVLVYPYTLNTYNPQRVIPYNTAFTIAVGSITVIAYPDIYAPIRSIGSGLSFVLNNTTQRPGYKVYTFTAGSGTITF